MVKRIALIVALILSVSTAAFCAELTDPKEIIKKSTDRLLGLKNYKFVIEKEGWDFNMDETAESTKSLTGEAGGSRLTKGLVGDVNQVDDTNVQWMTYSNEIRFVKTPKSRWWLWMKILRSDYVPDMLINGLMRYNYGKNKFKWSIKTKVIIVGIPRHIDTESGNFLYSNWNVNFLYMNMLMNDIDPVLDGIEKVNGRDAYKIGYHFDEETRPTKQSVNLSKWDIPKELHFKVEPELDWFHDNRSPVSDAYFYIDVETLDLVREQVFQLAKDDKDPEKRKIYYTKTWKDIEIGKLTKKDMK